MSDKYGIGTEIDDDYIDVGEPTSRVARLSLTRQDESSEVEPERADVSVHEEEDDEIERGSRAEQHADISHVFDTSGGNGAASSTEELIDENAVVENDGRSETRTFFYVGESDETKRQQYRRMMKLQDGVGDPERDIENNKADMRRWVDAMASQLDMSPYHKERVKHVCQSINMKHMAHYSTEKVILAVISLVANEDDRFIRDEDGFRDLMEDIGSDLGEIRRVRTLARNKSDLL